LNNEVTMRRQRPTIEVGLAALLALASACGSAAPIPATPPPKYPHAYAAKDCGPADGPAVTVYLSSQPMVWPADGFPREFTSPFVMISVWRSTRDALSKQFVVEENASWGMVSFCGNASACAPAPTGRVRLARLTGRGVLEGEIDVRSPAGEEVRGTFRAEWKDRVVYCG
jgi:hypothetical protein